RGARQPDGRRLHAVPRPPAGDARARRPGSRRRPLLGAVDDRPGREVAGGAAQGGGGLPGGGGGETAGAVAPRADEDRPRGPARGGDPARGEAAGHRRGRPGDARPARTVAAIPGQRRRQGDPRRGGPGAGASAGLSLGEGFTSSSVYGSFSRDAESSERSA